MPLSPLLPWGLSPHPIALLLGSQPRNGICCLQPHCRGHPRWFSAVQAPSHLRRCPHLCSVPAALLSLHIPSSATARALLGSPSNADRGRFRISKSPPGRMVNLLLGHLLLGHSQPPDWVQSLSGSRMLSQCLQLQWAHAVPAAQSWAARGGLAPQPWGLRGWPSRVQAPSFLPPFLSGPPGVAGAAAFMLSSGPVLRAPPQAAG